MFSHQKFLSVILIGIFVLRSSTLSAQQFDFNAGCRNAYNALMSLKLNEGKEFLKQEQQKNKTNYIVPYLQNYADFLLIYTSDMRTEYERLKENKNARLELLAAGDKDSPYLRFTQAEVYMQWAALSIKFGDYLNAIFEIKKAFNLLEENQNLYPDFKPNKKSIGVLYALIGSVPDKYKWGVNLLGLEGSVPNGLSYLEEVINYGKKNDFIYQDEAVIYYALLLFQLQNNKESAWQLLKQNGFPKQHNLLSSYACAHIGVYGTHSADALKILETLKPNTGFTPFPQLNYLAGLAKLHKLDPEAENYFKQFLSMYKGENHIKSSFQKIAWCYLLKNDSMNYYNYMNKAENLGSTMLEADKQAQREAEANRIPNVHLLRARLLCDGNYFERAAEELNGSTDKTMKTVEDQTEYFYRLGRIYNDWNKKDSALAYYQRAINRGSQIPRYFAANAAFESAKIYEQKNEISKAREYYNLSMSFENHEYKSGIDQKAKAALSRLK